MYIIFVGSLLGSRPLGRPKTNQKY